MKKLTNKKGFTLMEMIIVVAIIAILAVITIPTLTANTDKAEKAADAANLHAAKAAYQVLVMEEKAPKNGYYDVETSTFTETAADAATTPNSNADYCGQCDKHTIDDKGDYIEVVNGVVQWHGSNKSCE